MYNKNTDYENAQFDLNRALLKEASVRIISTKSIMEICNVVVNETLLFEL